MPHASAPKRLGLFSATGLVIASMIGSGVFVTSGFLAKDLDPASILLSWLLGGILAACGALCYAAVASKIPRSGGEYRFLHDLVHPFAGYLAGWVSVVFGFAAPIAMAAMASGAYAEVLSGKPIAMPLAILLCLGLGGIQATGLRWGEFIQNLGVLLKVAIILLFLGGAAVSGILEPARLMPTSATVAALGSAPFAIAQIYIGFAFAGWSAAVYLASEVQEPARNVPRAMLLGCGVVTLLYLLLNTVFVSTLSPAELARATQSQAGSITLGHLVAVRLLGEAGGRLASGMILMVLVSTIIAMTMTGPRVIDAMARDGFLPAWGRWKESRFGGAGPVGLLVGLAIVMLVSNTFESLLNAVGVTLAIFGAMSASSVLKVTGRTISPWLLGALGLFLSGVGWSVFGSLFAYPMTLLWMVLTLGAASACYGLTARNRQLPSLASDPP